MFDHLTPQELDRIAIVALSTRAGRSWHLLAQAFDEAPGALALARGERSGFESPELLAVLPYEPLTDDALEEAAREIHAAQRVGARLVTITDHDYPANLRYVYDRPPFLFVRGELLADDDQAIAVVGTRQASPAGLGQAARLAAGLVDRGITVLSGLALGIDGAAHTAALDSGGRTVAVIGNGIARPTYPRAHADLAERIVNGGGAIVSQFPPGAPPRPERFPLRNRTMSGMALGTVVVEASNTSGARMQARIALEHGKRVFLVRELVMREKWAQRYAAERPGATVVESADDVLDVLDTIVAPDAQLTLG